MVFELVNCPSCGRGVVSTLGPGGRRHVIDVEPIEDGTVIIVGPSGSSKEAVSTRQTAPPLHRCTGAPEANPVCRDLPGCHDGLSPSVRHE
jgi:hypothetical protein